VLKAVFETFGFGLYSLAADIIMTSDLYDPEVEFRVLDFCLKMRFEPLNFNVNRIDYFLVYLIIIS
jgi:hypothetical protein